MHQYHQTIRSPNLGYKFKYRGFVPKKNEFLTIHAFLNDGTGLLSHTFFFAFEDSLQFILTKDVIM